MADKIEAGPVKGDGKGEVAALEAVKYDDAKEWPAEVERLREVAAKARTDARPIVEAAAIVAAGMAAVRGGKG